MRKKIVAGNWKMNKTLKEGEELLNDISRKLNISEPRDVEVIVCSPFIHLSTLVNSSERKSIKIGAQNCSCEESGAFTGEISTNMIRSTGSEYVIIGHSERRSYYNESNEILNKKVVQALKSELNIIFCCGELLKDREDGNHFNIVKEQLHKGIFDLSEKEFADIIIAYEPVWAIGTGVTASSEQAQEMHKYIRTLVDKRYGKIIADNTSILYGGSCNAKNASELFSMPDVDGGLIGGASLKSEDFNIIISSF